MGVVGAVSTAVKRVHLRFVGVQVGVDDHEIGAWARLAQAVTPATEQAARVVIRVRDTPNSETVAIAASLLHRASASRGSLFLRPP
jgi:hypothetical protein